MRKLLTLALVFALGLSPALAQFAVAPPFGAGQIPGVPTGTAAIAGNIGEYVESIASDATSTVTITIATPAVITWTGHGFTAAKNNASVVTFTNSGGALPTGITSGTAYYIIGSSITTDTFQIATSVANAIAGTAVATSGSQSGTQTGTTAVTLSSGVAQDVAGIQLTAGEWDISGTGSFAVQSGTTLNQVTFGVSNATANAFALGVGAATQTPPGGATTGTGGSAQFTVGPVRVSPSSTTTYFLVNRCTFSGSTCQGYGRIRATRVH